MQVENQVYCKSYFTFHFLIEWLWADYMLYDYFKDRFMTKLDIFGQQRLEYEKQVLRNLTDKKLKRCNQNLGDIDCQYFRKGELKFLDELNVLFVSI